MPIDKQIFGEAAGEVGDSNIFKDLPPEQSFTPKGTTFDQSMTKKLLDLRGEIKPKTQEQADIIEKFRAAPWGSGVPKLAYQTGGAVTDLTGSPVLGMLANMGVNAIPSFGTMYRGIQSPTIEQTSKDALSGQRQTVLEAGRKLGYKVPPTTVNPSFPNQVIEDIGGKAATAQKAADMNEAVSYRIAQKEAGLQPNEPITTETLKAARDRMAQPHRDIAALEGQGVFSKPPFKSPKETLQDIQEARAEAKGLWNRFQKQGEPTDRVSALAASAKADALEQVLEQQVIAAGKPDLAQAYKEARKSIAKNFTVERAMRGSTFDPAALSRLESRTNAPLGGEMETIMDMYRDFPKAMNAPQVGGSVGVSQLMPWAGATGGGAVGAIAGGALGAGVGAPVGLILGQAAPRVARDVLLSNLYQAKMANFPVGLGTPALLRQLANPAVADPALLQYFYQ